MARRSGRQGAADSRCPACRAPLLTQWVGQVAALRAAVDPAPIQPGTEQQIRGPNRLTWCLLTGPHHPPRLLWRCHPRDRPCTRHTVVAEHHCPPATPDTLF
jgi:hypothetical protein